MTVTRQIEHLKCTGLRHCNLKFIFSPVLVLTQYTRSCNYHVFCKKRSDSKLWIVDGCDECETPHQTEVRINKEKSQCYSSFMHKTINKYFTTKLLR